MSKDPIEIKIDNKEVYDKLLDLAKRGKNLKPLMKNIAGILASATEDNFREEGRPNSWTPLAESTIEQRKKKKKGPHPILQLEGQLAASVSTDYDDESAVIGSNKAYAAIHQLGGQAGWNHKVEIPARPYLKLTDEDYEEILQEIEQYLNKNIL